MTTDPHLPSQIFNYRSPSPDKSRALGQALGRLLEGPAVIAFHGELGAGKTTFIQGLARGIGVADHYYVTSPSYTLINTYPGRIPFHHIDLYRIGDIDELDEIGFHDIIHGEGLVAIEWADRWPEILPAKHINIAIEIIGSSSRRIIISTYGLDLTNLVRGLKTVVDE
jgi:tRNA threonylcarbamoyladenosine biosynthesis protein TsaE